MKTLLLYFTFFTSSGYSKEFFVTMEKHSFVPRNLEIEVGDVVTFVNKSTLIHNVVSKKPKIRSKMLKKDDTFSFKFEEGGIVSYYCEPHRNMGMTGEILVNKKQ